MKELNSFTVERLEEIIAEEGYSAMRTPKNDEVRALARIALAAKRAEPVAWVVGDATLYNSDTVEAYAKRSGLPVSPLYTTPQLNSPEIPDGWKLVPIIAYPSQWAAGQKAHNNAGINKVDAVYKAMVAAAPDASGFDPSLPGAEATVITHYHTPDGYKLVPTEITKTMRDAWDSAPNNHEDDDVNMCNAYRAMIAAAPEPQNQQQNIPEIIPQGWIKCSDRMPEDDDFVLIWPLPDFGVDLHVSQYIKFHKKGPGWFAQVSEQNYGVEFYPITVTHWMPLPDAPEKKNG